ncbi:hypothetical protein TCAL_08706 [Tigriopus californicus]|uniref:Uncharacterized protein n=2 Tax=Tigriopus californicus TaxID=6832 RepID=A0A553NYM0_TIGCA|nr:hypothetical protein TCAL_08706 [Tigriopus californicus]
MDVRQILPAIVLIIILILATSYPVNGQDYTLRGSRRNPRQIYLTKSDSSSSSLNPSHQHSLLDTFSLSFVGNFNFANTLEGLSKIMEGISSFIDLSIIRATVDVVLDKFMPGSSEDAMDLSNDISGPIPRRDVDVEELLEKSHKKEMLKQEITTVVGAALLKQECYQRTACMIGHRASGFAAKDVLFIMAEKIVPSWKYTLDLIKNGSQRALDCDTFICSTERRREGGNTRH